MLFPLGGTTKDSIIRVLSVSWPLSAIKIWNALVKQNHDISYKAVYKSLQEMQEEKIIEKIENEYQLNTQWLKSTANTALEIFKGYQGKNKIAKHEMLVNFTVYRYSDEFYRILNLMLLSSGEIRLASKSPALLLRNEAKKSFLRERYVNALLNKIRAGELVYYLFPTEVAVELLNGKKRKIVLEELKELEQYPNFQIRHAPIHSVVKMAIIKNEALIGLAAPPHTDLTAFLKIEGTELSELSELYNSIFANAQSLKTLIR